MAVFKCKMCGGTLNVSNDTVAVCDYCGTQQSLPKSRDEGVANLFDRANNLRINFEFDKAEDLYEKILEIDNNEAEAHWGIVLCKYGIEYVEDPATHKRVPTCHRTNFGSLLSSREYQSALKCATPSQAAHYEEEAVKINDIQRNILTIAQRESAFDIFICYKETDPTGRRTLDSTIANDIYHQLTAQNYKVFYAPITLEDKLGQEYEPYIFAALNSAKVMLVIGTKPEYFNAVWVKNEWGRFLKLMKDSSRTRILIPCYRDMDPYALPEDFAHLQAQDMGKIGFISDLIRGISKLFGNQNTSNSTSDTVNVAASGVNIEATLKRVFIFLEDGDWRSANDYCEKVLDADPENPQAYLGKLLVEYRAKGIEALKNASAPLDTSNYYQKVCRFGDQKLIATLKEYNGIIIENNKNKQVLDIYNNAVNTMNRASNEKGFLNAAEAFESILGFKDSAELAEQCRAKAIDRHNAAIYMQAKAKMDKNNIESLTEAISIFETIAGWNNTSDMIAECARKRDEIITAQENAKTERLRHQQMMEQRKAEEKAEGRRLLGINAVILIALLIFQFVLISVASNDIGVTDSTAQNFLAAALFNTFTWLFPIPMFLCSHKGAAGTVFAVFTRISSIVGMLVWGISAMADDSIKAFLYMFILSLVTFIVSFFRRKRKRRR